MNVTYLERKKMGLAAGQARLLSITARKSDCEFQSMRLSHQKIAMARELADLSNEYQNSLTQTKLIYDYYGTGDTSTPLTYGLMMQPSALNDYMPITLTSTDGRVVLNSRLAQAAKDAGIPQEGLGTLPSEELRNRFIFGLEGTGVINSDLAGRITELPYAQGAGFGGGAAVSIFTESGNFDEFVKYLGTVNGNAYTLETKFIKCKNCLEKDDYMEFSYRVNNTRASNGDSEQISLQSLLKGEQQYYLDYKSPKGEQTPVIGLANMQMQMEQFLDWLLDEFSSSLSFDNYSSAAMDYAYNEMLELLVNSDTDNRDTWLAFQQKHTGSSGLDLKDDVDPEMFATNARDKYIVKNSKGGESVLSYIEKAANKLGSNKNRDYSDDYILQGQKYIGYTCSYSEQTGCHNDGKDRSALGINLNNIAIAFLTYFADFMNGLSATDSEGKEVFEVKKGLLVGSHLANDNMDFQYTWKTGKEVSSDDLGQATFYDSLFNQICANGWIENKNVEDKDYLQQMLQSGMMFISRVNEDNYYYQTNYGTDNYIKEIQDETAIAYAEARYSTEKAKLNAKEETIDLKMKNLDTEISSLTTEYDTVKSTISKNIEKSFKRYSA